MLNINTARVFTSIEDLQAENICYDGITTLHAVGMQCKCSYTQQTHLFLPVLYHHHVLLATVSGTADVPHPAGLTGIITIDKVL